MKLLNKIAATRRRLRRAFYTERVKRQCKTYLKPLRVNGDSRVNDKTILGRNVNFNGMHIKGDGAVRIGDNFHSGPGCEIITSFHRYDDAEAIPYDSRNIDKSVVIEDNVWLGDRVIVLGGVTLGEGCIIQAGSVVVQDVPCCGIAGGHPAKVFKYRDKEHYFSLKAQGRFH